MSNTLIKPVLFAEPYSTTYGAEISCYNSCNKSFLVRYYAKGQSKSGSFPKLHTHSHNELLVHLNGKITYSADGNEYFPSPGDIILARAGEPHSPITIEDEDYEYLQIDFPLNAFENMSIENIFSDVFDKREFCHDNLICPSHENRDTIIRSTRKIIALLSSESANKLLIYSYVVQLMNAINSSFLAANYSVTEGHMPSIVFDAVQYIYSNLSTIRSVNDVAKYVSVSPSYLTRMFKRNFGYTPYEYIVERRIEYAKTLMCYKGKNVSEACKEAGFNDYSNFIALFKRKTGHTPSNYKKIYS